MTRVLVIGSVRRHIFNIAREIYTLRIESGYSPSVTSIIAEINLMFANCGINLVYNTDDDLELLATEIFRSYHG